MKRNNIILITIAVVTLLTFIIGATYAYFATGNLNITNVVNANTVTEQNNMVFDTLGGGMLLNVTASNMVEAKQGNVAAENNTTLTVNFTSNTDYSMVCTYDIVYEWTSADKYMTHTTGVTDNEFVIQGTLASNVHVKEGTNSIKNETDLSTLTYNNYQATVVSGAQIDGTGSTTSTAVWTLSGKFYNVTADQSALSNKTYTGNFKVTNVSCVSGEVSVASGPTSYWFAYGIHSFPDYELILKTSGPDTGSDVYIGQDDNMYYTCANDGNEHEVCLSQPYTQYGLEGHTYCNDRSCPFTSDQQASAKEIIYQAFIDAGIMIDINNDCFAGENYIGCDLRDNVYIRLESSGDIFSYNQSRQEGCAVVPLGGALCGFYD